MRVSREESSGENRERIAETAARIVSRSKGFDGVGVDAIMDGTPVRHAWWILRCFPDPRTIWPLRGGNARALGAALRSRSRYTNLRDLMCGATFSEQHCADRANGCAIAALGADMARQGEGIRRGLTAHVHAQLDRLTGLLRLAALRQAGASARSWR